jgi:hypothetical protein
MEWSVMEQRRGGGLYSRECGSLGGNLRKDDGQTGGHYLLVRETGRGRSGLREFNAWQLCKYRCCLNHFVLFCKARYSRKEMQRRGIKFWFEKEISMHP